MDLANFSITEAALTGFRVVRGHPPAVLGWAGLQFVLIGGSLLALAYFAGPVIAQLQAHGLPADPTALEGLMQQTVRAEPMMLALSLVIGSVLAAAMNRAVLTPEKKGLAYLRLGRDELAQLGLRVLLFMLWVAANLAFAAIAQGLAALSAALGPLVTAFGDFALTVASTAGLVYVSLRLSLASAATFANRRIDLRTSWTITQGSLTPIMGAFCLALLLTALVLALGMVIVVFLASAVQGVVDPANIAKPDMSSIAGLAKPMPLTMLALISLLFGLMSPLLSTPFAFIYQQIAARKGAYV
jgi:hypothetical protein